MGRGSTFVRVRVHPPAVSLECVGLPIPFVPQIRPSPPLPMPSPAALALMVGSAVFAVLAVASHVSTQAAADIRGQSMGGVDLSESFVDSSIRGQAGVC